MPRNVRNFWFDASVDGRDTRLSSGPTGKDGGMDITVKVRDNGEVSPGVSIIAREVDGILRLTVTDDRPGGGIVFRMETKR